MTHPTDSIERKVADALLERSTDTLTLHGVEYPIAPPTLATIVMTSELAATLPSLAAYTDNLLQEVLRHATHARTVARIAATLILGAKRILERRTVALPAPRGKLHWFASMLRRKPSCSERVLEIDRLTDIILHEVSPSTVHELLRRRLVDMQIADFFAVTTSLTIANHIKPTVEVDAAPTPFGD